MASAGRADDVDRALQGRISREVASALRRRPATEARLAGALLALASWSIEARELLSSAGAQLARRGSFDRPLFLAAVRALAEHDEPSALPLLSQALSADEVGLELISASCFTREPSLSPVLARLASGRHPHLSFAAEVARVARGESSGASLSAVAPRLKEAYRIELCACVLWPLIRGPRLHRDCAPALSVLRDAERHLGRWLLLAELGARAGDDAPAREARERASSGTGGARTAWGFLSWALSPGEPAPPTRPSVELIARLSDRPSTSRDMTFLFRLAEARVPQVKPLLEGLAKAPRADDAESAVRAAFYLARDHGRRDAAEQLGATARSRRDPLRTMAAAALFDLGEHEPALEAAGEAASGRTFGHVGWAALIHAARSGKAEGPLLTEINVRRLGSGCLA